MRKKKDKAGKVSKGAPSGFVVSLIFHAVVFFVAGLFVVFTVLPKEEPEFKAPPPVERPKMKLKKPKVKIKKSSQPKPSSRIVAKVKSAKMPEIQIPDLVGTGEGLLGGLGTGGEFMDIPEISVSQLGSSESVGNDLVGQFYDFKRARDGHWIQDTYDNATYLLLANKFIESGFRDTSLSKYYRAPRKLYAQCLVVSPTVSEIAPSAFDTDDAAGGAWMVHYKGKLVHKDGITFRFVCAADYFIVISVDGKVVWGGVWNADINRYQDFQYVVGNLYTPHFDTIEGFMGMDRCSAGEWITLEPGVAKDIDIVIGDEAGACSFIIAVEEQGVKYEIGPQGYPVYPIFRTAQLSHDMVDAIYKDLPEGEVCVTNGPIFRDF